MEKLCGKCGETKWLDDFHKNKRTRDGHQNWCKPCMVATVIATQKAAPERENRRQRLKAIMRHGISLDDFAAMKDAQGGVCADCKGDNSGKRLQIDHDHSCCPGRFSCGGCVRALVCHGCNQRRGSQDKHLKRLGLTERGSGLVSVPLDKD